MTAHAIPSMFTHCITNTILTTETQKRGSVLYSIQNARRSRVSLVLVQPPPLGLEVLHIPTWSLILQKIFVE